MRTHKKHGVLMAGINGFKVYALNDTYRIVSGNQFIDVTQDDAPIVAKFVTLKYQPAGERERLTTEFLKLAEAYLF